MRMIGQCCFKYHYPDCNTSFSEGYTEADGVVNLVIKNGLFLSHLYINAIFLPKQARNNHRESTQKQGGVLCTGAGDDLCV